MEEYEREVLEVCSSKGVTADRKLKGSTMKKKMMLRTILGLGMVAYLGLADDTDIKVVLPEELMPKPKALTDDERLRQDKARAHSELIWRLNRKLPYHSDEDLTCRFNTLGQLVKLCDSISVVKVVEVVDDGSKSATKRSVPKIKLTINSETNLLGHLDRDGLSLNVQWWDRKRLPQKGDRWLVFITRQDYEYYMLDAMKWNFDKTKVQGKPLDTAVVMGHGRGTIDLAGGKTESDILAATAGSLQNLRQQKWDADKYFELLRELVLSPDQRIKDDAKIDLLNFLRTCASFDLNRALDDKNIDDSIKDYVRLILIPQREKK